VNAQNDEASRLKDLQLYKILDTSAEKTFDNLTLLATELCDSPISLISLVDETRQWFKSKQGLDASETPREQAFCAHAIQEDHVMIVEDAQNDERFANNPLVTGEPKIRFYAGAPLTVAGGSTLGTLCVIDRKPKKLSAFQIQSLEILRDTVVTQLELRRALDDFNALESIIPMCAWCRKIRIDNTDDGTSYWQPLHDYVANITPVSHGICNECKEINIHTLKAKTTRPERHR